MLAALIQISIVSVSQASTVQYSTVQYSTVQYSTVQYSAVQYSTVQYRTHLVCSVDRTAEVGLHQALALCPPLAVHLQILHFNLL